VITFEQAVEDARVNRGYQPGPVEPSIAAIAQLVAKVDRLNSSGSTSAFIDAQAELIDALLVALSISREARVDPDARESLAEWGYVQSNPPVAEIIPWAKAYEPLRDLWRRRAGEYLAGDRTSPDASSGKDPE